MIVGPHPRLVFSPSGLEISCIGLGEAPLNEVATRWCCGVASGGETVSGNELRVRPDGNGHSVRNRDNASHGSEDGIDEKRFGYWRTLVRPGRGRDEVRAINPAAKISADFQLAVDLGVTHLLALQGGAVLHGAAFEIGRNSVLAVGFSGSGKSTVAAAALTAGGTMVSDDLMLAAALPSGEAGLATLRRFMVLRDAGFQNLAEPLRALSQPLDIRGETRWKLSPEARPSAFTDWTVPQRLWLVSVDRRLKASRVASVDQATAMAWLIRGTTPLYISTPFDRERDAQIEVLKTVAESCPAYRIRLGRDLLTRPKAALERLLRETAE